MSKDYNDNFGFMDGIGPGDDVGPYTYLETIREELELKLAKLNTKLDSTFDLGEIESIKGQIKAEKQLYREKLKSIDRSLW